MNKIIKILSVWLILYPNLVLAQIAALLPNGQQVFLDNNGNPLSSGTVDTYSVGTTTRKTTWQDAGETIPNTNPVVLNAAGRAIIYGDGNYRQIVKDRLGNLIWDAPTSAFGTGGASQIGDGTAVGTILPWSGLVSPVRYVFAYGQELSRATYSILFTAITLSSNVNCTNGSPVIGGLSDTTQIPIGAPIEVSCVAAGSTVTDKSSTTVTVSNNSSITAGAIAIFFPWGNGNGSTTFNVPDLRGRVLPGRDNMGGTAAAVLTTAFYTGNPDALGANGGSQSKSLVTSNMPAYTPAGTIVSTQVAHSHFIVNTDNLNNGAAPSSSTYVAKQNVFSSASDYSMGGSATVASVGLTSTATPTITSTLTGTAQGGTAAAFSVVQPSVTLNYIIKILPDTNISTLNVVTSLGGMTGDITCGAGLTCSGQSVSVQAGVGLGDVLGPASSIDNSVVVYNGITGKIIKDSQGAIGIISLTNTGNPSLSFSPTGNPTGGSLLATFTSTNIVGTTAKSANREFLLSVGLTSNLGSGVTNNNGDKVAGYFGMVGNAGSGDIWSLNSVTVMSAGFPIGSGAQGYELDFNNLAQDVLSPTNPTGFPVPFTAKLNISGADTFRNTFGIALGGGKVQHAIAVFTDTSDSIFYEASNTATYGLNLQGAHTFGIHVNDNNALNTLNGPLGVNLAFQNILSGALLDIRAGTDNRLIVRGPATLATGSTIFEVNDLNSGTRPIEFGASQFLFTGGNVGIGTGSSAPASALEVSGTITTTNLTGTGTVRANTAFSANGSAGLSVTKTVRAGGGASDCTLIYTFGLLTGGSC